MLKPSLDWGSLIFRVYSSAGEKHTPYRQVTAVNVATDAVPKVDSVAGPGNTFVADANRQLFGEVGTELLAGPTGILVVADRSADALTVATDLLSQAESGPDSPAVLIVY